MTRYIEEFIRSASGSDAPTANDGSMGPSPSQDRAPEGPPGSRDLSGAESSDAPYKGTLSEKSITGRRSKRPVAHSHPPSSPHPSRHGGSAAEGVHLVEVPSLQDSAASQFGSSSEKEKEGANLAAKAYGGGYGSIETCSMWNQQGNCRPVGAIFLQHSCILRLAFRPFQRLSKIRGGWWLVYLLDIAFLWHNVFSSGNVLGNLIFERYPHQTISEIMVIDLVTIVADFLLAAWTTVCLHLAVTACDLAIYDSFFAAWATDKQRVDIILPGDKDEDTGIKGANDLESGIFPYAAPHGSVGRYASEIDDILSVSRTISRLFFFFFAALFGYLIAADMMSMLDQVILGDHHKLWILEYAAHAVLFIFYAILFPTAHWFLWMTPVLMLKSLVLFLSDWKDILDTLHGSRQVQDGAGRRPLREDSIFPSVQAVRTKEDNLIAASEELNRKCSVYFGFLFGIIGLMTFTCIILFIMIYQLVRQPDMIIGTLTFFFLVVFIRILIHMASVVETFRSSSCSIFRGFSSWELSNMLGEDPLLLPNTMKDLEPIFAFQLMGGPVSYGTAQSMAGSIVVGLMLTVLVPLLSIIHT